MKILGSLQLLQQLLSLQGIGREREREREKTKQQLMMDIFSRLNVLKSILLCLSMARASIQTVLKDKVLHCFHVERN